MIEFNTISKQWVDGTHALSNISLQIQRPVLRHSRPFGRGQIHFAACSQRLGQSPQRVL